MTLYYDVVNLVHGWVDINDEDIALSPQFIDEESAIAWYGRVSCIMFEEFGVKK